MPPTHDVTNQPPPLVDYNLYDSDPILSAAIGKEMPGLETDDLSSFGERVGSAEVIEWGFLANRNDPVLKTHDRYGNRLDRVDFHPAWHSLMDLAIANGLHSRPWEPQTDDNGHTSRTALLYMASQIEAGHFCPVSMTTSVVPALRASPTVAEAWMPKILSRHYDPSFQPVREKHGALFGMGMTEKQGGSDVRANTTEARRVDGGGEYRITGHKWFTSAPMSDAFLVLAQAQDGLSCFLMPRWEPDGSVNAMHIQRLKDKLGNRSNASSEVEFVDAYAELVGEEGRGIATIIEMVNGTRLDCVMGSTALMRQAVSQAAWHAAHRSAFGSLLIDQPLMQNVLADLEIETEVATLMLIRLAGAFDRADTDPDEALFKRVALPVAKYWVTKRTSEVVREAMECLGGNGYVEDSILPRLFRESPLNAIWEGSGNVIALDLLRAINKEPASVDAFFADMEASSAGDARIKRAIDRARDQLRSAQSPETEARRLVEVLAKTWAASLIGRFGDDELLDSYLASRIEADAGSLFGTLPPSLPLENLARKAIPQID